METILVPTDFSDTADNAVDYAVELAKFLDAGIILVNAFSIPYAMYEPHFQPDLSLIFQKSSEKNLADTKDRIHKIHGDEVRIECIAQAGAAYDVITALVKERDVDLIVMGIVGETGNLKERIMGKTSITVARKLEVPTFIIPKTVKYRPIQKITFACDLEGTEETDLVYVVRVFSRIFDAELEIVNVGSPMEKMSTEKAVTYLYIEDKLQNLKHNHYQVTGEDPAIELEKYFNSYPTDVIMLSPKKHNLFHYLFHRSVTSNLALHVNMPILAIH